MSTWTPAHTELTPALLVHTVSRHSSGSPLRNYKSQGMTTLALGNGRPACHACHSNAAGQGRAAQGREGKGGWGSQIGNTPGQDSRRASSSLQILPFTAKVSLPSPATPNARTVQREQSSVALSSPLSRPPPLTATVKDESEKKLNLQEGNLCASLAARSVTWQKGTQETKTTNKSLGGAPPTSEARGGPGRLFLLSGPNACLIDASLVRVNPTPCLRACG